MKHEHDMNCGNINLNEDMIVAVVMANSPVPEKKIRDFNGIRTHGLCVSAAVNLQLLKLKLPQRSSNLPINLYFRSSHHLRVYSFDGLK